MPKCEVINEESEEEEFISSLFHFNAHKQKGHKRPNTMQQKHTPITVWGLRDVVHYYFILYLEPPAESGK